MAASGVANSTDDILFAIPFRDSSKSGFGKSGSPDIGVFYAHLNLLARLFRERRDNPMVNSYHFGKRVGKRGAGYFVARAALLLVPFLLLGMVVAGSPRSVDNALTLYCLAGVIYIWMLPSLVFHWFGVRKLDRQILDELSLTRMKGYEIVFGLFYWPSLTVLFMSLPLIFGLLILLMFSGANLNIVQNATVFLITALCMVVNSLAATMMYYSRPMLRRLLLILGKACTIIICGGILWSLLFSAIRMLQVPYESKLILFFPLGVLAVTLIHCEALFSGASMRSLEPPLRWKELPLVPTRQRMTLHCIGVLAALIAAIVMLLAYQQYLVASLNLVGSYVVKDQRKNLLTVAALGWTIIPFLIVVSTAAQSWVYRKLITREVPGSPRVHARLHGAHYMVAPFFAYAILWICGISMRPELLLTAGRGRDQLSMALTVASLFILFGCLSPLVAQVIGISQRRGFVIALLLLAAGCLEFYLPGQVFSIYATADWTSMTWMSTVPHILPLYGTEGGGSLASAAFVSALAMGLVGGREIMATRMAMRLLPQLKRDDVS